MRRLKTMEPEKRMRIQELQFRLEELKREGASYSNGFRLSLQDIRLALPEDLYTIQDVEMALELEFAA